MDNEMLYGTIEGVTLRAYINPLTPVKVIFNDPATIVFWNDGSKTVVKCSEDDVFDTYRGFTMAYLKKIMESGKKAEKFIDENKFNYIEKGFIQKLLDLMAQGKGI